MSVLFIVTVLILLFFAGLFLVKYHNLRKDIDAIVTDLQDNSTHSDRLILRSTNEKSTQQLLKELNFFIDRNRELFKHGTSLNQGMKNTVTNLSHDLKTPLTVISGYAEVTKNNFATIESGELMENLSKIEIQSKKLVQTINKYFDLNKLNAGEMKTERRKIDISEILREEVLAYYLEIEHAALQLDLEISEEPTYILGDETAVRRIFTNLLSNAVKYGKDGDYLAVKSWQTTENIFIEITDHGKGLQEENQQQIFERLATLEDATDKNYQGSGLGLSITKSLVENQQGKISLYSKPFVRTTFTIEFPLV